MRAAFEELLSKLVAGFRDKRKVHDPREHVPWVLSATGIPLPAKASPRVLMAAGHGYGNVGDEAQLGACIARWRGICPTAHLTVFTPNPAYTVVLHGADMYEWAPRVAWFRANTLGPYDDSPRFRRLFQSLRFRLVASAWAVRRGIPFSLCNPHELRIIQLVQDHDILHISGGGFLTGMTHSRLWENCLLMRVCQILRRPYILTGQTIGVFKDKSDADVAYWGLKGASYIGLRDKGVSERELEAIGIAGSHVESTCDDALFCPRIPATEVSATLSSLGVDVSAPYAVVNYHDWGQAPDQKERVLKRFAELCEHLQSAGYQIVTVAMAPGDVEPTLALSLRLPLGVHSLSYNPDYRVVRGLIGEASLVLTMKHHPIVFAQGEMKPVVAVALDDYYYHKNLGALMNTGQQAFLLGRDTFFSDQAPEALLRAAEFKYPDDALSRFKEAETRPYKRALAGLKQKLADC